MLLCVVYKWNVFRGLYRKTVLISRFLLCVVSALRVRFRTLFTVDAPLPLYLLMFLLLVLSRCRLRYVEAVWVLSQCHYIVYVTTRKPDGSDSRWSRNEEVQKRWWGNKETLKFGVHRSALIHTGNHYSIIISVCLPITVCLCRSRVLSLILCGFI